MIEEDKYMLRCCQLAMLGQVYTSPNPMVGAVLVYQGLIIGEGWHEKFGDAHAEINCLNSVAHLHRHLIKDSTLYISLEPCSHHGKTPPCTDAIIRHQIKRVVFGSYDANPNVNGKDVLLQHGVHVTGGVLLNKCNTINKVFLYNQLTKKAFITAKWAQSSDAFMNGTPNTRTYITNELTQRWVHKQRAIHSAIMIGKRTFLVDKPKLTNRLFGDKQPIKIIIDRALTENWVSLLQETDGNWIIINDAKDDKQGRVQYLKVETKTSFFEELQKKLWNLGIASVLVEGGPTLLHAMLAENAIQEIIQITNTGLIIGNGLKAPTLPSSFKLLNNLKLGSDCIQIFNQY
jgi:diaminohydroxyphosphoribosylaminopyrimidine deaminase/5-amino-6-(5-phosphoribosylamino)uracil reductase